MDEKNSFLEVRNLTKIYESGTKKVKAVEDISFNLEQGEFVTLLGPTGCGKSTILEILGGLKRPTKGEAYFLGNKLDKPHPDIGIVFQEESTFPWLTTIENIEFGLKMKGVEKKKRRSKCKEMIELVGLEGFEDSYPGELSGGMKQRVSISRNLITDPEVILMDEPFGALDEQTRIVLGRELIRIWKETESTILFVTHSIGEAVRLSDRILVMTARPGKLKETINVDLPQPREPSTEGFGEVQSHVFGLLEEEGLSQ